MAANTFSISKLHDHESATYQAVFGEFYNVNLRSSANRIILATGKPLPEIRALAPTAAALDARLRPYDMRIRNYDAQFSTEVTWDPDARVLTDQYSPANLLNQ